MWRNFIIYPMSISREKWKKLLIFIFPFNKICSSVKLSYMSRNCMRDYILICQPPSMKLHSFRIVEKFTMMYRLWIWLISMCDALYLQVIFNKITIQINVTLLFCWGPVVCNVLCSWGNTRKSWSCPYPQIVKPINSSHIKKKWGVLLDQKNDFMLWRRPKNSIFPFWAVPFPFSEQFLLGFVGGLLFILL